MAQPPCSTKAEAGQRWSDLFSIGQEAYQNDGWDTQLTATVDSQGVIKFNGFCGDYELTINGATYGGDRTEAYEPLLRPIARRLHRMLA